MSRSQLAAMAGVAPSTVVRIENGEIDPTLGTLSRILSAAGYTLSDDLQIVSDPVAVAAARSVLDPGCGLGAIAGVERYLQQWEAAGFIARSATTGSLRARAVGQLARRAGLSARLVARPGLKSYQRPQPWGEFVLGLRDSGLAWASTGAMAANRLVPSADARWPVFYVTDPDETAQILGLEPRRALMAGPALSLIPFDGIADVGVVEDEGGLRWVDHFQVMIDCFGGTDRMPEQAEALAELFGADVGDG